MPSVMLRNRHLSASALTGLALASLGLEFTEKEGGELVHNEWLPDSLQLMMVDRHAGNWTCRLDIATVSLRDLAVWMGDASFILFEQSQPAAP
jgi:hypothetical protein